MGDDVDDQHLVQTSLARLPAGVAQQFASVVALAEPHLPRVALTGRHAPPLHRSGSPRRATAPARRADADALQHRRHGHGDIGGGRAVAGGAERIQRLPRPGPRRVGAVTDDSSACSSALPSRSRSPGVGGSDLDIDVPVAFGHSETSQRQLWIGDACAGRQVDSPAVPRTDEMDVLLGEAAATVASVGVVDTLDGAEQRALAHRPTLVHTAILEGVDPPACSKTPISMPSASITRRVPSAKRPRAPTSNSDIAALQHHVDCLGLAVAPSSSRPSSRPTPTLTPPNGTPGKWRAEPLIHTKPASNCSAKRCARVTSPVKIEAVRPYSVSLAIASASAGRSIRSPTGPARRSPRGTRSCPE